MDQFPAKYLLGWGDSNNVLHSLIEVTALFMHCLPAHRDEEVVDIELMDRILSFLMKLEIVFIPKKRFLLSVYMTHFSLHNNLFKIIKSQRHER
ncbi:hypothetical protein ACOWKN_01510 [Helicobacter pylori]